MRKLGPGVYVNDELHQLEVDIPELLDFAGWEDTPENRDRATEIAVRATRMVWPKVPQIVVKEKESSH